MVNIASVGAYVVSPTAAVYCATKYAVRAIGEGPRQELDPSIRVTTISPGVVESELAHTITDPEARSAMEIYRAVSIAPGSIGEAVAYAIGQPDDIDVNEIVIRPTGQR